MANFKNHRRDDDDALLALDAELDAAIDPHLQALLDHNPDADAAISRQLRRSATNRIFGYGMMLLAMPFMMMLFAYTVGTTLPNTWPLYILQVSTLGLGLFMVGIAGLRRLLTD